MSLPIFALPIQFQDATALPAESLNANFLALLNAVNAIAAAVNSGSGGGGGGSSSFPNVINAAAAPYNFGATGNNPAQNTGALQALVSAIITAGVGAWIILPAGNFQLAGTVTISGLNGGIVIQGSSAGTTLIQTTNVDTFDCSNNSHTNQNGIHFRDITFQYNKTLTSGVAISASNGGSATVAEWCSFYNCPTSFTAGTDGRALACGLVGCYVNAPTFNNSTQVILSGAQGFVYDSIIQQTPQHSGGPSGCVGIQNIASAGGNRISGNQISDLDTGILISAGSNHLFVDDNDIQCYSHSIVIQPATNAGTMSSILVCNNNCRMGNFSTAQTPGVYIDTAGGNATNVSSIYLVNNLICGWNGPGLQINQGTDIVVHGGQISGNGQSPASTLLSANVAISGAANIVMIVGVDMGGTYQFTGTTSPYGLSINSSSGPTNVYVYNCNLIGSSSGATYTSGVTGGVQIYGCPGYNDQSTVITYTPATGTPVSMNLKGYFGPATAYVTGGTVTAIRIGGSGSPGNGHASGLTSGTFHLAAPTTFIEFDGSGAPNVVLIGE